jgi:predicted O-methyltransferase YrrM
MSTLWYERHACEVHAVDDNPQWCTYLRRKVKRASIYFEEGEDNYVGKIGEFPLEYFDLIVIDGSHRYSCLMAAWKHLKPCGILLIDNTDMECSKGIDEELSAQPHGAQVFRLPGWCPGNFFPTETTICISDKAALRPVRDP